MRSVLRRIGGTLHVSVRIYMITGCNHRVASLEGNSGLLLIQSACKVCAHARCVHMQGVSLRLKALTATGTPARSAGEVVC